MELTAQLYVDANKRNGADVEIIVDDNPDIRTGKVYKDRMPIRYAFGGNQSSSGGGGGE